MQDIESKDFCFYDDDGDDADDDDDDDEDKMKDSDTKSFGSVQPQLLFKRLHAIAANDRIMSSILFDLFIIFLFF